jgi:hypothetical protein
MIVTLTQDLCDELRHDFRAGVAGVLPQGLKFETTDEYKVIEFGRNIPATTLYDRAWLTNWFRLESKEPVHLLNGGPMRLVAHVDNVVVRDPLGSLKKKKRSKKKKKPKKKKTKKTK